MFDRRDALPVICRIVVLASFALQPSPALPESHGSESEADPTSPYVQACHDMVEQEFRRKHPSADDLVFAIGSMREWQESKTQTGIRGEGWYLGGRGNWKDITYSCIYDRQAGQIVDQQLGYPGRDEQTAAVPKVEADPDSPASRACLEAIESRLRDDRPRLQELDFNEASLHQWQESEAETGISGAGEYVGGAGNRKTFIFRCVFDEKKQKTSDASYKVKS